MKKTAGEFNEHGEKVQFDNSEKIYLVLLAKWMEIAGAYNSKLLTRQEDKFVAIAGLASEMQKLTNEEYIAGLWKRNLLHQLAWYVAWEGKLMGRISRPEIYLAPSWSWACLNGPVAALHDMTTDPVASIVDYGITLADNNEFGRVTDGYVRIRGRLSHATYVASDKWLSKHTSLVPHPVRLRTVSSNGKTIVKPFIIPDAFPIIPHGINGYPSFPIHHALGCREFWLLPLTRTKSGSGGLLLKHTGIKGQYQRIAAFIHDDDHDDSDDGHMDLKKEFQTLFNHRPLLHPDEYEELGGNGNAIFTII